MASLERAVFSLVWVPSFPGLLETASGKLVTRAGYTAALERLGDEFTLPWESETRPEHWSRFWSSYLASPSQMTAPGGDSMWNQVIPLRWKHATTIENSGSATAEADVFLYPSAIAVIIRVTAAGDWTVPEFADGLAALRGGRQWATSSPRGTTSGRSLDGIADDLTQAAFGFLADDEAASEPVTVLSVAAPTVGTGRATSFALARADVQSCIAGLAALSPPSTFVETLLLVANRDSALKGARVYASANGHAIWRPDWFLTEGYGRRIECLEHNHSDLAAQVNALASVVTWAGEQIEARRPIPIRVQPFVQRAAIKLTQLHAGNPKKTYRSGLARMRIEPLRPTLDLIEAAL